jgi:hypothetical protein
MFFLPKPSFLSFDPLVSFCEIEISHVQLVEVHYDPRIDRKSGRRCEALEIIF